MHPAIEVEISTIYESAILVSQCQDEEFMRAIEEKLRETANVDPKYPVRWFRKFYDSERPWDTHKSVRMSGVMFIIARLKVIHGG